MWVFKKFYKRSFTCLETPDQTCSSSTPHPTPHPLGCALWWPHLHATGHWQSLYGFQTLIYSPETERMKYFECLQFRTEHFISDHTLSLATQCTVAEGFLSCSRSFSRLLPYAKYRKVWTSSMLSPVPGSRKTITRKVENGWSKATMTAVESRAEVKEHELQSDRSTVQYWPSSTHTPFSC